VVVVGAIFLRGRIAGIEDGPLPLHTYGLMIALGFVLGIHLASRWAESYARVDPSAFFVPRAQALQRKPQKGETPSQLAGRAAKEEMIELSFWIVVGAMVGSRVLFIIVNWGGPDGYGANPAKIFDVFSGGFVFYGGFIGATLASIWYAKKRGIAFRALADVAIPVVALGHFFGRMGCMAAGCCWGKVCENPNFLFGAHFPEGSMAFGSMSRDPEFASFVLEHGHTPALHPTQLYEGLGELTIFVLLLALRKNKRFHGQILALWLMLYAVLRLSIETFRGDWGRGMLLRWPEVDPMLLSTSQVVGVCMVVLGATLYFLWKPKREQAPTATPAAA